MDKTRKKQVLEVLNYWKTIEFLGQIDIPEEKSENKKLIEKVQNGKAVSEEKLEIFSNILTPYIIVEKILEDDIKKFVKFPLVGKEMNFCIGRIERNLIVEYLEKFIEKKDERNELAYPKKSAIAWCSFKTDMEGIYLQDTFQFSPILWAISVWEKEKNKKNNDKRRW